MALEEQFLKRIDQMRGVQPLENLILEEDEEESKKTLEDEEESKRLP